MPTPKITITNTGLEAVPADVVVIGTVSTDDGVAVTEGAEQVDAAFNGKLISVLTDLGASGKVGETIKIASLGALKAPVVLATGMGEAGQDGPSQEQVRRACGAATRALSGTNRVALALSALDVQGAVEGALLGGYRPAGKESVLSALTLVEAGDRKAARATIKAATAVADAVCVARDLINTPPNQLYPETFAARAKDIGEDAGLSVEVLDEKALRRKGYGGVLGVGDGSARKPRLVRLSYKPAKPKARIALVGKGITFDTGGISLKPPAKMEEMTSDMSGAAVVIAAVALAAKLNYPVEVTATVPMAENMPSGSAYRPGDVLTMYGGTTVEVLNTDAEGRLVLADAIVRACEDKPDYLIETSTLTGAQVMALGMRNAGIMGSAEFRDRVAEQGRACGEGGWAMPLPEELRAEIQTPLADMTNHPTGAKQAGMLLAGVFLSEFVAEGVPWAHLDVAGPAYNAGAPWGYTGKGGTGVPLRTIAAVMADIAANG